MELNNKYHKSYDNNINLMDINLLLKKDFYKINNKNLIPELFVKIYNQKINFDIILYSILNELNLLETHIIYNNLFKKKKYLNLKLVSEMYNIDINFIKKIYNLDTINIIKNFHFKNNEKNFIKNESEIYKFYKLNKIDNKCLTELIDYITKNSKINFYESVIYIKYILDNKKLYLLLKKIINKFENKIIYLEHIIYNNVDIDKIFDFDYIDDLSMNNINMENYNKVIQFYYNNYEKFNYLYSRKLFELLFPKFDINFYKYYYDIDNNCNEMSIFNSYVENINKNRHVFENIDNFCSENKFNIIFFKNYYGKIFNSDIYYFKYYKNNNSFIINFNSFYDKYQNFNLSLFNYFNKDSIKEYDNSYNTFYELTNRNIIFSVDSWLNLNNNFNLKFYKIFYELNNFNDSELIIHYECIGKTNNYFISYQEYVNKYKINLDLLRFVNYQYKNLGINEFLLKYKKDELIKVNKKYIENNICVDHLIYKIKNSEKGYIGSKVVNNINEVLIDLEYSEKKIDEGISLIIRAKNEEKNIKVCIDSVIDLVDEIIFVDNNSTDNTYNIVKNYLDKNNKIKLYQYNINVSRVGSEQINALDKNNSNTLATFYNWCLSKSTKNNIFKWDADFICIRNNFVEMVDRFNLKKRKDKFALWFTGITLFLDKNNHYINLNSNYDEYRVFSYLNGFKWYNGLICEYTDPYLESIKLKFKYNSPIFFEIKRTDLNEFSERSLLIDNRDLKDFNIINNLKLEKSNSLIKIDKNIINSEFKKIIIITPSLSYGGGNKFIINIYKIYKLFGYNVKVISADGKSNNNRVLINEIDINDIINYNLNIFSDCNYIIFNSIFIDELKSHKNNKKFIFITHSDLAYSNLIIKNNINYFDKILTVNDYTINKLNKHLKIDKNKFIKIINQVSKSNKLVNNLKLKNKKKIGMISRLSEDKNVPMLLCSLQKFLNKYNDYNFYFVGDESDNIMKYYASIVKNMNIKNIYFLGYKKDIENYYLDFDFIILPSVSEGCSYNLIESMLYGKPIIASNVGGNHEILDEKRCIFIEYDGIRDYESNNFYICNYIEQLNIIGYIILDNENKNNIINEYNSYNLNVIPPIFMKSEKINIKKLIDDKMIIWERNVNKIFDCLEKMIYSNKKYMIEENKKFLDKYFNEQIYFDTLLKIL